MKSYLLIICLALSLPAAAQEAVLNPKTVNVCFKNSKPGRVDPGCIGKAARQCQTATPDGETTIGIGQCLMAEMAQWDKLLNREYGKTRMAYADSPDLADQLRDAQRAWIALRDADCELEYARWGGGSMRSIAAANCRLTHTARRALSLRNMRDM